MAVPPVGMITKQQFTSFFEFMSKNQFWTNKIKLIDIENLFAVWTSKPAKKDKSDRNPISDRERLGEELSDDDGLEVAQEAKTHINMKFVDEIFDNWYKHDESLGLLTN